MTSTSISTRSALPYGLDRQIWDDFNAGSRNCRSNVWGLWSVWKERPHRHGLKACVMDIICPLSCNLLHKDERTGSVLEYGSSMRRRKSRMDSVGIRSKFSATDSSVRFLLKESIFLFLVLGWMYKWMLRSYGTAVQASLTTVSDESTAYPTLIICVAKALFSSLQNMYITSNCWYCRLWL